MSTEAPAQTPAASPAEKLAAARKQFLLESSRPGILSEADRDLFSDKELKAWSTRLAKEAAAAEAYRKQLSAKQNALANEVRLKKLLNRDPAVKALYEENQALKAEIAALKANKK